MRNEVTRNAERGTSLRSKLILAGVAGLVGGTILAWLSVLIVQRELVPVLIGGRWAWAVFAFLLALSLAEIPLMVYGLRKIVATDTPGLDWAVVATNGTFVAFAAVYGGAFILLTGRIGWGLALCGLGLVRFGASLIFARPSDETA